MYDPSIGTLLTNIYRPQTMLREGNVFTGVCLSTGVGFFGVVSLVPGPFRWVGMPSFGGAGRSGEGGYPLRPLSRAGTWNTSRYGMHATWMHSCAQWFCKSGIPSSANMEDPLNFGINLTPKFLPDQMPKENEREAHVRGLFDLRTLPWNLADSWSENLQR